MQMLATWGLTIPITMGISAAIFWTTDQAQQFIIAMEQSCYGWFPVPGNAR